MLILACPGAHCHDGQVAMVRRVSSPLAGAAGLCLLAGLMAGCTETRSTGVYEAKVVGTETDDAGRISATLVDVEFVIETSTSGKTCEVAFYDASGARLRAPNSTTKEEIYSTLRSHDDPQYRGDASRKYNKQIKVGGVPRSAKLDC